jgi:hypothetical protein
VTIPRWILFLVAAWVIAFGVFRIYIALRPRHGTVQGTAPNFMRKGLYARAPRTHVLFGVLYVILGGFLIATGLGWAPVVDMAACAGQALPDRADPPPSRPDSRPAVPIAPATGSSRGSDSADGK